MHLWSVIVEFAATGRNCHFCQMPLDIRKLPAASGSLAGTSRSRLEVAAETPLPSQGSSPRQAAFSPAKSIGMFAYPKNGRNSDQQLKDESECSGSAKQLPRRQKAVGYEVRPGERPWARSGSNWRGCGNGSRR